MMKKPDTQVTQPTTVVPTGKPLGTDVPTMVEWMTTIKWEDGTARETTSLSVTIEGGVVRLAVNDRAMKRTLYLTAGTLLEAVKAAERHLEAGTGDWRPWNARTKGHKG